MSKPEFVYTTYISTTPERLWQALTEPAFTRQYWDGLAFESDWQAGSKMTVHLKDGVTIADPAQVVLEADPYRRLSYTWHTFTPQWAASYGLSDEYLAKVAAERRSKVTFDIEPAGETGQADRRPRRLRPRQYRARGHLAGLAAAPVRAEDPARDGPRAPRRLAPVTCQNV